MIKLLYFKPTGALLGLFPFPNAPASDRADRARISLNWLKARNVSQCRNVCSFLGKFSGKSPQKFGGIDQFVRRNWPKREAVFRAVEASPFSGVALCQAQGMAPMPI